MRQPCVFHPVIVTEIISSPPHFADDPRKWEGWQKWDATNPYERLCLDPRANPTAEEIQQRCTLLLQWWQKKLPLKTQPSNPLAQLLGRGLDEANRYLVDARTQLLDPVRRAEIDRSLVDQAELETVAEFSKYISFSIKDRVLTREAEANLSEYGQRSGLADEQIRTCIDHELRQQKARRATDANRRPVASPGNAAAEREFLRILRLIEVTMDSATDSVRMLMDNLAHNLGLGGDRAEWLLDDYLEDEELRLARDVAAPPPPSASARAVAAAPAPPAQPVIRISAPARLPSTFASVTGAEMVLVPTGEFIMGSNAADAAPNEQPLTPVKLSAFYLSRHPITNAQYERFDPPHRQKRMHGAGDRHPVVYVSSLDAVKFCLWLSQTEGKRYRLPTEAEWEYAARGPENWKYPWGNNDKAIDVANFADASTTFPWRDPQRNDGYPESSPVGAFPRGASLFGMEDMAGNVWEWCLDFYQELAGAPRFDPRGASIGPKRVYRGGSWKSRFSNLRGSARASNAPDYSSNDLGFRIVCEGNRGESRG